MKNSKFNVSFSDWEASSTKMPGDRSPVFFLHKRMVARAERQHGTGSELFAVAGSSTPSKTNYRSGKRVWPDMVIMLLAFSSLKPAHILGEQQMRCRHLSLSFPFRKVNRSFIKRHLCVPLRMLVPATPLLLVIP